MTDAAVQHLVSIIVAIFGLLNLLAPKSAFEIRKKWAALLGVKMSASNKTWQYYRISGIVLLIVAFLMWTSA
jgi:hypothetical protein